MTTQKVGSIAQTTKKAETKAERATRITVRSGETLTSLAKKYGMTAEEFKNWTGVTAAGLKAGQKITLPADTVPEGKGIFALIRKYGMTLEEFGKLNNLPKPYNKYVASKNEKFYVKNHGDAQAAKPAAQKASVQTPAVQKTAAKKTSGQQTKSATAKPKTAKPAAKKTAAAVTPMEINKAKWGSSYTPQELATKIYEGSSAWGAVGKPDFDALVNQINPKNASAVIKAYDQMDKGESLINTITSEISSSKSSRKNAVMHVYDALAKEKGYPAAKRADFQTELDKQFDSWGFVSTKKLDAMINEMLVYKPVQGKGKSSGTGAGGSQKVTLNNGKTFTLEKLREDAIAGGKRDKGFSKVKNPYLVRPLPHVNEAGKIEAESSVHYPTNKNGSLKGKVVIVNAGHGGYGPENGYFDAGTVLSVKNAQGQEMPIEEWRVAKDYVTDLTKNLQAKGATVVVVSGPVKKGTGGMCETQYLENLLKGNRGSSEIRKLFKNTSKSNIAFMSIHVESSKEKPEDKKCTVRANHDSGDMALAQRVQKHVGETIYTLKPQIETNNYYVTRAMGKEIPAVLVEIGNIANDKITNSLLSSHDRGKYTNALALAIEETLLNK